MFLFCSGKVWLLWQLFFIFVVIPGQYSGEHLKDHWSSGLDFVILNLFALLLLYEPRREKTGFLHMRKQRRKSASR